MPQWGAAICLERWWKTCSHCHDLDTDHLTPRCRFSPLQNRVMTSALGSLENQHPKDSEVTPQVPGSQPVSWDIPARTDAGAGRGEGTNQEGEPSSSPFRRPSEQVGN